MYNLVLILILLSWVVFIVSVLLMSPKWWLWMWIAWFSWSNEYWSKKSVENTLKKAAVVSIVIFALWALILPYLS